MQGCNQIGPLVVLLWLMVAVARGSDTAQSHQQLSSSLRQRNSVRGANSIPHNRNLGISSDKDDKGKNKGGKQKSGDKSHKAKESDTHDNEEDEREKDEYDSEDLPQADDEEETKKSSTSGNGKNKEKDVGDAPKHVDGKGENNGDDVTETFEQEIVETFRRDIPDFAVSYVIASSRRAEKPDVADYNELAVVSEEFLDRVFVSVFEDVGVGHFGTAVYVTINDYAPFLVDFRLTLEFALPGEVPTVRFVIDRVREAFDRESSRANYLFDLNTMSETNPFSATTSFTLITGGDIANSLVGDPNSGTKPTVGGTNDGDRVISKKHAMISFLTGIGLLVIVLAGFLWFGERKRQAFPSFSPPRSSRSISAATLPFYNGKLGYESRSGEQISDDSFNEEYASDDDTIQYLNTLRERYQSDEATQRVAGFQDAFENEEEIKDEKDDKIVSESDNHPAAEVAYGSSMTPLGNPRPLSVRDLLNFELNSTEVEDDLGSLMN